MAKELSPIMSKSPWIVHVNCNSCNGCDIEVLASLTLFMMLKDLGL